MDKNSFEIYKYLPADENESNQFLVVQNDGTFLSVNKEIQYVTQVQDVKEVLEGVEPCAVYDVSSQQFLIDVHNSADLISVPDQFMLPESEGNIFANNYLLPVPNCTEEQIDQQDESIQYQEPETQNEDCVEIQSQKEIDSCTEITLTDDQYHTLEQKGWTLLETNDKVFILDTLGLHDITSNDKLIQKLKSENESCKRGNDLSLSNQEDTVKFVIGEDDIKLTEEIIQEDDCNLINVEKVECAEVSSPVPESIVDNNTSDETVILSSVKTSVSNNIYKVKTDMFFKDVPNKIVLGETENGKRLFAKITKLNHNNGRKTIEIPPKSNIKQAQKKHKPLALKNITNQISQLCNSTLDDNQFETLLRLALQNSGEVECSVEDVASADSIVTQLLKVPAYKPSVLGQNLIITKVSIQDDTGAVSKGGSPVLVTGRVTTVEDDRYYFVHLPGMLKQLMNKPGDLKNGSPLSNIKSEDKNILHVHVTELKRADNVLRISITLNKRQLPDNTNSSVDNKRKQSSMVFGCSACAAVFQTESELYEHQMAQCTDVDDVLTIDLEKNVKGYTIVENGIEKTYYCNNCQATFTKLFNCIKHLKIHVNGADEMSNAKKCKSNSNGEQADGLYKCKMCPSSYLHSSTLSKHIVSRHIKVNTN